MPDENSALTAPGFPENLSTLQTAGKTASPEVGSAENEHNPETGAASPGGFAKKVGDAAAGVCEKFGITLKRGRGRPPIHGRYSRENGSDGKTPVAVSPVPPVVPPSNVIPLPAATDPAGASLFRKAAVAAVKGVLAVFKQIIRIKAGAAGLDKEFTEKALRTAEPDPEVLSDFNESLELVMRKHNVAPKNSEEWALAINAGRLAAPFLLLFTTFNAEIERKRAMENSRREAA